MYIDGVMKGQPLYLMFEFEKNLHKCIWHFADMLVCAAMPTSWSHYDALCIIVRLQ